MKNLKKALVLVLAFAMIFSMFAINASAASFTDDDAIVNTEAVKAMTQLGVINGYEDGSFLPTQIVTRAEMCKMICVAMGGGSMPLLTGNTAVFSDTQGHWANSYIAYCYTAGIVSGDAGKGGIFRPDATVTATEAAKMMLVTLGYNSALAGFTGADWDIHVAMAANEKGLFSGLGTVNAAAGLSRDNAAQLIYNGIAADMVEYSNVFSAGPDGQLVSTPTAKNLTGKTILSEKFKVNKVIGILEANATFGLDNTNANKDNSKIFVNSVDGYTTNATIPAGSAVTAIGSKQFEVNANADLLGQEVSFYAKKSGDKVIVIGEVTATNKNKVVTTYANLSSGTDSSKMGSMAKFLKDNSLKLIDSTGTNPTQYATDNGLWDAAGTNTAANYSNDRGDLLTLIDNDNDGEVEYALKTNYTLTKVTANNTSSEKITLPVKGELEYKSVIGEENVAKGDYVLYSLKNGTYTLTKAETVTGNISTYSDSAATTANFTVGGTKYYPSKSTNEGTGLSTVTTTLTGYSFTSTYIFYLDKGGNPVAYKLSSESTASSNHAVVLDSGASTTTGSLTSDPTGDVKLLLADGTVATYSVDMLTTANKYVGKTFWTAASSAAATDVTIDSSESKTIKMEKMAKLMAASGNTVTITAAEYDNDSTPLSANLDAIEGTIVTYSVGDNGKVTLAPTTYFNGRTTGGNLPGHVSVYKNVSTWNSSYVLTQDTIFLFNDGTTRTSLTGLSKITSDITANVATFVADANSKVVKVMYIEAAAPSSTAKYAYISTVGSTSYLDGKEVTQYGAVLSDGTYELFTLDGASMAKGDVGSYVKNSSGKVTTFNAFAGDDFFDGIDSSKSFTGFVSAVNGTTVTVTRADGKKFAFNSDGLNIWNVTSATNPVATELVEGNQVTIMANTSSAPKIEAIYVTKTTASTFALSFAAAGVRTEAGVTATYTADKYTAMAGDTVTITVTLSGTATSAATFASDKTFVTGNTISGSGVASADTTTITTIASGAVDATVTYSYIMPGAATTITIS